MLRKILSNYLIILVLSLAGCEEFYNFEANKLDKKAQELIERSEIVSNTDEKIKLLLNALIKIEKIQSRYPKTKVARLYRKKNKINNLNSRIDKLKIISSKQKIQKEKNANINEIRKNIDSANVEFRNGNKLKSSLNLLNAAELSIKQIEDTRTKSRLSNEISKLRILLNDEENAFENLLTSEEYINEMYTDLPKKIKNLSLVTFFVLPPNIKILKERLLNRHNGQEKLVEQRMKTFNEEVSHWSEYNYVVINDNLNQCYDKITSIILSEKKGLRQKQNLEEIKRKIDELVK